MSKAPALCYRRFSQYFLIKFPPFIQQVQKTFKPWNKFPPIMLIFCKRNNLFYLIVNSSSSGYLIVVLKNSLISSLLSGLPFNYFG